MVWNRRRVMGMNKTPPVFRASTEGNAGKAVDGRQVTCPYRLDKGKISYQRYVSPLD